MSNPDHPITAGLGTATDLLGISTATVKRDTRTARASIARALSTPD